MYKHALLNLRPLVLLRLNCPPGFRPCRLIMDMRATYWVRAKSGKFIWVVGEVLFKYRFHCVGGSQICLKLSLWVDGQNLPDIIPRKLSPHSLIVLREIFTAR